MNIQKLLGVPYMKVDKGYNGTHCLGLCRLYYRAMGYKEPFTDDKPDPVDKDQSVKTWQRVIKYANAHMKQIEKKDLREGDFVLFDIEHSLHTGIYLGYGKLLSMYVPTIEGKSKSTIYHRRIWEICFKRAYRFKEGVE